MNPFRAFAAWWRRRRAVRASEIEAALATLTRAGIIAPSQPNRPADPRVPHASAAPTSGCQCGICTGKMQPADMLRMSPGLAQTVDGCLIAVSAGSCKLGHIPLQRLGPNGVTAGHVLVVSDAFFQAKILPVLQAETSA